MREDDSNNWFSRWDEDLPSPEELTPLSQTLITPDLALAFDIPTTHNHNHNHNHNHDHFHRALFHHQQQNQNQNHQPTQQFQQPQAGPNSGEFETSSAGGGSGGGGGGGGNGVDEPARTLKRPRLVWTPQLHKRFVDAVAHLGIKNAVPKTIMQLMSVDGLTRENVASHLQKYRLYLKRMQSMNSSNAAGIAGGGGDLIATSGDPATDHLFASGPVPAHFLNRGNLDHIGPYMAAAAAAPPGPPIHHGHQMGMVEVPVVGSHYQNHQYNSHRQMGQFGHFEQQLIGRGAHIGVRMNNGGAGGGVVHSSFWTGGGGGGGGFGDDVESGAANGRKVLTLFPTGDD